MALIIAFILREAELYKSAYTGREIVEEKCRDKTKFKAVPSGSWLMFDEADASNFGIARSIVYCRNSQKSPMSFDPDFIYIRFYRICKGITCRAGLSRAVLSFCHINGR
jgi:hypothetical protein